MMIGAIFACLAVAATDGDTLKCADDTRVRLAWIDSPEIHGCHGRKGRVCVPGDGKAARSSLSRLALGKTLRCTKTGASYNRVVAYCSADGVDLSCYQFRAGMAIHWTAYDRRNELCRR